MSFSSKVLEVSVTAANICKQNGNSLVQPYETVMETAAENVPVLYHIMKAKSTFTWGEPYKLL